MINVLHLRDTDRVCGPGKTIIETARATNKLEFSQKVGLFLLEREGSNVYMETAVARGVEVIPIRTAHQLDPRIITRMLTVIREHRIHLIHSHEYKSDILAFLVSRLYPIPIMTTVHGWIRNRLKSRAYVAASQAMLRRFNRVVAVSSRTREAIIESGVSADRVVVIRNGIVTRDYEPADHDRGAFRSQFGIPPKAPLIGYVGRLSPEKGQRDLLMAAAAVLTSHPDAWFTLVGDGPDESRLKDQAQQLGIASRVVFTGHLRDARPAFRDLDVLALTSHTEGLPNVVLESLCMETPVLATDVGGTGEIVKDGVTGLLIPPRAPEAVAGGLRRMLEDAQLRRRLALAGKQLVHREFSFADRVAKEESVYREILATGHAGLRSLTWTNR
jgi:glycosyltransferase involved in cell wall biosynthesis